MDGIARQTEAYLWHRGAFGSLTRHYDIPRPLPVGDALSEAMAHLYPGKSYFYWNRQEHFYFKS